MDAPHPPSPPQARGLLLGQALGLLLALTLACAGPSQGPHAEPEGSESVDGAPAAPPRPHRNDVRILDVREVGPYLAATLEGRNDAFRLFFPVSAACDALIHEGNQARYLQEGTFGLVRDAAGGRCSPVGVAQLTHWRDVQARRRSAYLAPREQAEFRAIHQGEEFLLVRGRFPLSVELRWPEPMDAVAFLPATEACRAQLEHGETSMEFRARGPEVLVLDGPDGAASCPIQGLALPIGLD